MSAALGEERSPCSLQWGPELGLTAEFLLLQSACDLLPASEGSGRSSISPPLSLSPLPPAFLNVLIMFLGLASGREVG